MGGKLLIVTQIVVTANQLIFGLDLNTLSLFLFHSPLGKTPLIGNTPLTDPTVSDQKIVHVVEVNAAGGKAYVFKRELVGQKSLKKDL